MIRLLLLLALVATPLIAAAHGGHHAPASQVALEKPALAIGSVSVVSAPSRCPGGGHENCCCHEPWCTTTAGSVVIADAGWRELATIAASLACSAYETPALRSAALLRFSPRGPPALS